MRGIPGFLPILALSLVAACGHVQTQAAPPLRVIIQFSEPTQADDEALLARLTAASGARLRVAAGISPKAAAYHLECPREDPRCTGAIAALRGLEGIQSIEPDTRKK